jgi:4-aminobutyrate aminotransferase/(S)-3-amino-2-methylpropionate transaminase
VSHLLERLARVECPAFGLRRRGEAIVLARGEGHRVWDADGREYVDLAAGFGAALLGHGHPAVVGAIARQSARLLQGLGDVHANDAKLELLERLAALHPSGDAQVILCQSGADAVTAAMKTATLHTGRHAFVAFDGGYHGLGYAPLAACGYAPGMRAPFAPQLNPEVRFAPYPGVRGAAPGPALALLREQVDASVAAVIIEPVLGRGGCVVPPDAFLGEVCAIARHHGALVIADEIWTGLGRTGAWWAGEALEPDVLCLGKALGGGLPISACAAPARVMAAWGAPVGEAMRTASFLGHPLACAAAIAHLDALEAADAPALAEKTGTVLRNAIEARGLGVRGTGMALAVEVGSTTRTLRLVRGLLERGWITLPAGADASDLQLSPPLNLPAPLAHAFAAALHEALEATA